MEKKKVYILTSIGLLIAGSLLIFYLIKRKNKKAVIKGGYIVPKGTPNMVDALHSFERRKSDGFGGRMSTKINEALFEMYKRGVNPDVTNLKVNVDSTNYSVTWEATIEPSKDGKAYTGIMTFGSAGSDADKRAIEQKESMKEKHGGKDYKLLLDFKNPKGIYIRQLFYKYTRDEYPAH